MINVQVRFFAGHRDIVGCSTLLVELEPGTSLGVLWRMLSEQYPRLAAYTGRVLFARNQEFADPTTLLVNGDEVSFIPPVSGGAR
jgi:molybdopterin converting factor subunit 1